MGKEEERMRGKRGKLKGIRGEQQHRNRKIVCEVTSGDMNSNRTSEDRVRTCKKVDTHCPHQSQTCAVPDHTSC